MLGHIIQNFSILVGQVLSGRSLFRASLIGAYFNKIIMGVIQDFSRQIMLVLLEGQYEPYRVLSMSTVYFVATVLVVFGLWGLIKGARSYISLYSIRPEVEVPS